MKMSRQCSYQNNWFVCAIKYFRSQHSIFGNFFGPLTNLMLVFLKKKHFIRMFFNLQKMAIFIWYPENIHQSFSTKYKLKFRHWIQDLLQIDSLLPWQLMASLFVILIMDIINQERTKSGCITSFYQVMFKWWFQRNQTCNVLLADLLLLMPGGVEMLDHLDLTAYTDKAQTPLLIMHFKLLLG